MKITIHRGTQTIGGSCVEIKLDNHRILFDLGTPLMAPGGGELNEKNLKNPSIDNEILPNISGLYKNDNPSISGIFISHSHLDHCGLLNHIHPDIPVYCSSGTHSLIKIGQIFYPDQSKIFYDNFKIFDHWKSIEAGPFKITSYLMDHSGFDASSFLIEADNKRIFYSGDFRSHGRKSKLTQRLIENPISDIDCLLMEGTTLGGKHKVGFNNEDEVEKALYEIFSNQKDISFIAAAGSNVDRIVSLYKAARKSNKILVLDLYTYYVLDQLKKITPGLPPFDGDNIRIYYIYGHSKNIADYLGEGILYRFKNRKIGLDEIVEHHTEMVLKLPVSAMKRISKKLSTERPLDNAKFIYSMWQGYMEKDSYYEDFCREYNAELIQIHVSGHAYLNDLKKLAGALKPKKLVPIHTLSGDDFYSHFKNVVRYDDSVPFEV